MSPCHPLTLSPTLLLSRAGLSSRPFSQLALYFVDDLLGAGGIDLIDQGRGGVVKGDKTVGDRFAFFFEDRRHLSNLGLDRRAVNHKP